MYLAATALIYIGVIGVMLGVVAVDSPNLTAVLVLLAASVGLILLGAGIHYILNPVTTRRTFRRYFPPPEFYDQSQDPWDQPMDPKRW
jgi:uncharacterized membrane protein HdeD (DUF308 family)